jgi:arylsulfatase A-like enzyme
MPQKQPNILFITSDQHRSDSLGCYGHPSARTPHLDKLAFEGLRFTNAYTDCPVCIPGRTTIITGIQSHIYGKPSYAEKWRIERPREKFLGGLLTRAGYQTQLIGKTHWHTEPSFRAGFEGVLGFGLLHERQQREIGRPYGYHGLGGNECFPMLSQMPPHLYPTDWAVDRAVEFLHHRDKTQPFFLWLSVHAPHPPLQVYEPYYSMYDGEIIPEPLMPEWARGESCPRGLYMHRMMYNSGPMTPNALRKARAVYLGMVTNLDFQLGRLFGALMQQGLWDETWVLYTTDHGEHLGDFGDLAKSSFLEVSANLPFIVRPPLPVRQEKELTPGRVNASLVELADLLPTFCELAGSGWPADVTGRSLLPILLQREEAVRDCLHGQIDRSHMFHDGRHKYLYFTDDGAELVFDKSKDGRDECNLAGDEALRTRLRRRFVEHLAHEKHADLVDGRPRNDRLPRPDDATLRSWNPMGWQTSLRL